MRFRSNHADGCFDVSGAVFLACWCEAPARFSGSVRFRPESNLLTGARSVRRGWCLFN